MLKKHLILQTTKLKGENKRVMRLMKNELGEKIYDRLCTPYTKNIFLFNGRW